MNTRQRSSRRSIYYWKCDRDSAFHSGEIKESADLKDRLISLLESSFSRALLRHADGQGNHRTFLLESSGAVYFVRVEDGIEGDDHFEIETRLLCELRAANVPVPRVFFTDASRQQVPFSVQVIEYFDVPDLNQLNKEKRLDLPEVAFEIGVAVARWQSIRPIGYGHFDPTLINEPRLHAFHREYADYFFLHFERHLSFLEEKGFLTSSEGTEIRKITEAASDLFKLDGGCLVHKDLALWNILGTPEQITAFIDWDDAISGDAMDDLSLLACFHDGSFMRQAFAGYCSERSLPPDYRRRFWLHLLRNMIVKAVIRVGAGYFDRTDKFFLIGAGSTGNHLKNLTHQKIQMAMKGLRDDLEIYNL